MSTPRHPLHEALTDPGTAGEGYEVPVDLVRARVRRRRRVRAAARGGGALLAAGAVALVLPTALTGGGRSAPVATQGDWPAQFGRCGQPVAGEQADRQVGLSLEGTSRTVGGDRVAHVTTGLGSTSDDVVDVSLGDLEVSLVRAGVVVGVDDGRLTVALDRHAPLPGPAGGASRARAPGQHFDVERWSTTGLVSCAQYPDGQGDVRVPAGEYGLAVTQGVRWTTRDGSTGWSVLTETVPVTVTDEPAGEQDATTPG